MNANVTSLLFVRAMHMQIFTFMHSTSIEKNGTFYVWAFKLDIACISYALISFKNIIQTTQIEHTKWNFESKVNSKKKNFFFRRNQLNSVTIFFSFIFFFVFRKSTGNQQQINSFWTTTTNYIYFIMLHDQIMCLTSVHSCVHSESAFLLNW